MEATDVKLARVETALGTLIEEVRLLRFNPLPPAKEGVTAV